MIKNCFIHHIKCVRNCAAQCLFLGGYSGFPVHCKLKGETCLIQKKVWLWLGFLKDKRIRPVLWAQNSCFFEKSTCNWQLNNICCSFLEYKHQCFFPLNYIFFHCIKNSCRVSFSFAVSCSTLQMSVLVGGLNIWALQREGCSFTFKVTSKEKDLGEYPKDIILEVKCS